MSDNNRGAYTPQSDAPLSFDARRSGRGPGRPMPITLIFSGLILLVLVVGGGFALLYHNGARAPDQPPQPVGQPVGELRAAPESQVAAQPGLQVYQTEGAGPAANAPNLAPPPEQPLARPAEPALVPPVQAQTLPPPPAAAPAPAPAAKTAAPAEKSESAKARANMNELVAKSTTTAPAQKLASAAPAPKPAPAPPAPATKTTSSNGGALVQIGAYSTTALADAGWNKVARLLPGAMAGKTKVVEKIERDGHTLYRARVGGFASKAGADKLCADLRAQGESCAVIAP